MATAVNGTNQQFTLGNAITSSYPFTVAGWFYTDATGANQDMLCLGNSGNATDALIVRVNAASNALQAVAADSSTSGAATSSSNISTGTWHHACAIFAGTADRTIYLDGGNSGNNTTSVNPTLNQLTFGSFRGDSSTNWFGGGSPGLLAEWGMWSVALDAADITALSKGYSPFMIRPQVLLSYHPFSRGALTADVWRSSHTLTAVNSPIAANITPRTYAPTSQAS